MNVLHDSRSGEYRLPFGAVETGAAVTLAIDIWDAPGATVTLRTWTNETGESRYEMEGAVAANGAVRYRASLTPDTAGLTWYHFIITDANGNEQRYGARPGRTGGEGQLGYGEPPSFQLTVYDSIDVAQDGAGGAGDPGSFNHANGMSFPEAVARFLRGEISAPELVETRETLRESCPPPLAERTFELLETEDRTRFLMWLSGEAPLSPEEPTPDSPTFSDLDDGPKGVAKGRLWCASLIQMLSGDTPAGTAEQLACAWGREDADCETIVQNAADLAGSLPLFSGGDAAWFAVNDDVLALWRWDGAPSSRDAACLLLNRSLASAYDVPVPLVGEAVSEVISGYQVPLAADGEHAAAPVPESLRERNETDRYAQAHLYQLGSAVLYFHDDQRLQCSMEPGLGVLAHITSLPANPPDEQSDKQRRSNRASRAHDAHDVHDVHDVHDDHDIRAVHLGTFGESARNFVDWLAQAGVRYWQVLPVNPTDEHGSPYAGISAFAGNTRLLEGDSDEMVDEIAETNADQYRAFCEREADWLEPYACFMAIRQKLGEGKAWQEWPKKYRTFSSKLIEKDEKLSAYAERCRRAQFAFEQQWGDLRAYANERGVQIIGDMPIYVSADSADVWAHPEIFQLEADGRPRDVAGCPPDAFAEDGQVWGNPVYDWDALRESGYAWWLRRLERAFDLYDIVRLDHFIGFARYFAIPAGEKATAGSYHYGPGLDFFPQAAEKFGPLPIIAEDLGLITPVVRALVAACGFPGMDIVQFVDGNDPLSGYRPRPEKIAYTGTHDNHTLRGYVHDRYPDEDEFDATEKLLELVATCDADVRIVPLQDVLLLDDDARMNTPGTVEGNWIWQASPEDIERAADRLKRIVCLK